MPLFLYSVLNLQGGEYSRKSCAALPLTAYLIFRSLLFSANQPQLFFDLTITFIGKGLVPVLF